MKLKVMLIKNGISSKTGKPYTMMFVRGKNADGKSVSNNFFIDDSVKNQLIGIQEDDFVELEFGLNFNLFPMVTNIYKVDED